MSKTVTSWQAAAGLVVGAATVAALGSCAKPPVPTNRSVAPQEALDARVAWENGTKVILEMWQAEEAGYASALAVQLKCTVADLPRQKPDAKKLEAAHGEVIAQFEEQGHSKYLALNADPRLVNPKVRQYYKDVKVTLPDGTSGTVEDVTTAGRTISMTYQTALRDAALGGRDARQDTAVQRIRADYLARRKAVADAIDAYLAQPKSQL